MRSLLRRLATIPETLELGRVTGLTAGQAHTVTLSDCLSRRV